MTTIQDTVLHTFRRGEDLSNHQISQRTGLTMGLVARYIVILRNKGCIVRASTGRPVLHRISTTTNEGTKIVDKALKSQPPLVQVWAFCVKGTDQ